MTDCYRIDAVIVAGERVRCVIIRRHDQAMVHRTRTYTGEYPAIRALRAAESWIQKQGKNEQSDLLPLGI